MGARNSAPEFTRYFNSFFNDLLYPYMQERGIDTIVQLGDLFDDRNSLSLAGYEGSKSVWFDQLVDNDFMMITLLGNHDIRYRNTVRVNSQSLFLRAEYPNNIHIVDHPETFTFDNVDMDIIPWICQGNQDMVSEKIRTSNSSFLAGHLELVGFELFRGMTAKHGQAASVFDRYEMVFSGHYHTSSRRGNILYTGTPYEMTWSDYGDPKGFWVLDTITKELEFVQNPDRMHHRLVYDNGCGVIDVAGKIVKVSVKNKDDKLAYERFIKSIKEQNPFKLTIVDSTQVVNETVHTEVTGLDNKTFMRQFVESRVDNIPQRSKVLDYLTELEYNTMLTDD